MSQNAIILATGHKGSGKTYRLQSIASRSRRMIAADPEGKWPLLPGDIEVRSARALLDRLRELDACDPATRWRIVYRDDYQVMREAAPGAAFAVRNCTLVCDELAWLCKSRSLPEWLGRVVQFGRERRVNLLGTTREPQEIHDLLLSQADLVFMFRTNPGNGLDRLAERYGRPLRDELPKLKDRHFRTYGNAKAAQLIGRE